MFLEVSGLDPALFSIVTGSQEVPQPVGDDETSQGFLGISLGQAMLAGSVPASHTPHPTPTPAEAGWWPEVTASG